MQPPTRNAKPEDIDVAALCRAFWRAEMWIISLSILAGLVTFVGLSMMRPLYTSEARVLIENDNSPFTHTATDQGRDQLQVLDEQAVQCQVQVITSRDLVLEVVRSLDLINSPEFAKDAGVSYFQRLLNQFGLGRGSAKSEQEKAAGATVDRDVATVSIGGAPIKIAMLVDPQGNALEIMELPKTLTHLPH